MSRQILDISDQANLGAGSTTQTGQVSSGMDHSGGPLHLLGIAGMIVGLPALVIFWIPVLGWLLMLVGLSLSVAALIFSNLRERPAGFAIAGIVLNSIALAIHNFIAMLLTIAQGFLQGLASILVDIVQAFLDGILGEIYQRLGPFAELLDLLSLFF